MTTISKEQAVQLALEAGFSIDNRDAIQAAEKLCQAAFKLGRNAGLEDIGVLATVGATYPELMQYIQTELNKDNTP